MRYQKIFQNNLLYFFPEKVKAHLRVPAHPRVEYVNYNSTLEFWCTFSTYTKKKNGHWNAFGLENPHIAKSLNISVEINIPFEYKCNTAGVFLQDKQGNVYIGHRGIISNGRHSITKDQFFKQYKNTTVTALDYNKKTQIALISLLESPELAFSTKDFINEVVRIKNKNLPLA